MFNYFGGLFTKTMNEYSVFPSLNLYYSPSLVVSCFHLQGINCQKRRPLLITMIDNLPRGVPVDGSFLQNQ